MRVSSAKQIAVKMIAVDMASIAMNVKGMPKARKTAASRASAAKNARNTMTGNHVQLP